MAIDVLYQGMVLARDAKMMAAQAGTFVELSAPMPVGTQLVLEEDGVACPVRVERVVETGGTSGVFVLSLAAVDELARQAKIEAEDSQRVTEQMAAVHTAPVAVEAAPAEEDGKRPRRKTGRMRKVTR